MSLDQHGSTFLPLSISQVSNRIIKVSHHTFEYSKVMHCSSELNMTTQGEYVMQIQQTEWHKRQQQLQLQLKLQ